MTDTIIVSGGDIQRDFALDFLKREIEKTGREKICLIAADRGLEFFLKIRSGRMWQSEILTVFLKRENCF